MDILIVDDQPTVCVCVAEKVQREIARTTSEPFSVIPLFNLADVERYFLTPPPPRLVVLDLNLGITDGLDTLRSFRLIQENSDATSVAIFSGANFLTYEGVSLLRTALRDFGIKGVLPKNGKIDRMLVGLGRLLEGETWIPDDLMNALLNFHPDEPSGTVDKQFKLTQRETEVAHCVAKGMADKEIAKNLEVTPAYVRQVVSRILGKLGVSNRTKIAVAYAEAGTLEKGMQFRVS